MRGILAGGLARIGLSTGVAHAQHAHAHALDKGTSPSVQDIRFGTRPQEIHLTKITVSDLQKSYDFYTRILGLRLVTSTAVEMAKAPTAADNDKEFLEVSLDYSGSPRDPMFILIKKRGVTPVPAQAAQTWLAFKVPDAKAVMDAAGGAGFKPNRPYQASGLVGFLKDLDGYTVEVLQL